MDASKTIENFLRKIFLHRGIEVEQLSPPQSIYEHLTSIVHAQISGRSYHILSIRLKILNSIPCPKKLQKYNANSGIFGLGRIDVDTPESNGRHLRVGIIWVCVSKDVRKVILVMALK